MTKRIIIFTSTRAEYGLLRRLALKVEQADGLDLTLLISGTHLILDQGLTIKEIQLDGIKAIECIDIDLSDDSTTGICRSMGIAIKNYGEFFHNFAPDLLLLLGDRYETFCCAATAQICGIPVAHVHGGERTEGVIDEAFRHSITKMSHLHFPCCEEYQNRIIQMGESPERVYNVGSLGVENIKKMKFLKKLELENAIGFKLDKPFFLVTFHPVTLEKNSSQEQFAQLLQALDHYTDHRFIFTGSNADTGGQVINQMQNDYKRIHPDQCLVVPSLGYLRYLSAMKLCDAVIGNSSSGILEAPVLKAPTINIGDRQKGRVRTQSVVDCDPFKNSILKALETVSDNKFQLNLKSMDIPFDKPDTVKTIKSILQKVDLKNILKKEFYDK